MDAELNLRRRTENYLVHINVGEMGKNGYPTMHEIKNITFTPEILKLIANSDEFKGRWMAMQTSLQSDSPASSASPRSRA